MLATLPFEIKHAVRSLWRSPLFVLLTSLTLGLGIAANVALFAVLSAAFFQSIGVQNEAQVLALSESDQSEPSSADRGLSYLNFADAARLPVFSAAVLLASADVPVGVGANKRTVRSVEATSGLQATLGVQPVFGRGFLPEEDSNPGSGGLKVAMISESFWRDEYEKDPKVLQIPLSVDGERFQIVGVMPDSTLGDSKRPVALWRSRAVSGSVNQAGSANASRGYGAFNIAYARLAPGVSPEQAQVALNQLSSQLAKQFPDAIGDKRFHTRSLRSYLNGDQRAMYSLVFAATLMLLLIACANLAGLLSARFLARAPSLASREIFGASHAAIALGIVVESLLLSALGVISGLGLALLFLAAIEGLLQHQLSNLSALHLDWRTVGFASALGLMAGILCAIVPVRHVRHLNLALAVREHGRGSATGTVAQNRQRQYLVVAQFALSTCLLIAAVLLAQSLRRLGQVDPGFSSKGLMVAEIALSQRDFPNDVATLQGLDQLRALSLAAGANSVSFAESLPMTGRDNGTEFDLLAAPAERGKKPEARLRFVDVGYVKTMRMLLKDGRDFQANDNLQSPAVMLVNQAFVERYLTGRQAIGQELQLGWGGDANKQIVGVVSNVRHSDLASNPEPEMYVPVRQFVMGQLSLVARFDNANASNLTTWLTRIRAQMPQADIATVQWMDDAIANTLMRPKLATSLFSSLAVAALLLAAIGLLALMLYLVNLREREFGLRKALGAPSASLFGAQLRQSTFLVCIGSVLGMLLAIAGGGLVKHYLFQTTPIDVTSFALAALVIMVSGTLVCIWPSLRAAATKPDSILR